MKLKVEMAGNTEYNGINCRLRTAFENDAGEKMFIEFSHAMDFKTNKDWLIVNHLYRIDIEEDNKNSYTKSLYQNIIRKYHEIKIPYTHQSVIKLFNDLGCKNVEIIYCDYYHKKEYHPHAEKRNEYILGNIYDKVTQLSLFDLGDD